MVGGHGLGMGWEGVLQAEGAVSKGKRSGMVSEQGCPGWDPQERSVGSIGRTLSSHGCQRSKEPRKHASQI